MRPRASRDLLRHVALEAAAELWLDGGRGQVRLDLVAERAERSPAALALLFEDDEGLATAAATSLRADIEQRVAAAVSAGADPLKTLRQACRAYINAGVEWPAQYRLVYCNRASPPGQTSALRAALERAMNASVLPAGDLETASEVLCSLLHGVTVAVGARPLQGSRAVAEADHLIESALDVVMAGLRHAHCLPVPPPDRAA